MAVDVLPAGLVDVELNHLPADRTLRRDRMQPLAAKELEEFNNPY
jgi:hypothetical protein